MGRRAVRTVKAGAAVFDLTPEQKKGKLGRERYLKRYQRRLAKQKKGSKTALQNQAKDILLSSEDSQPS